MIYFSLFYIAIHNPCLTSYTNKRTRPLLDTVLPTRKNVSYVIHFEKLRKSGLLQNFILLLWKFAKNSLFCGFSYLCLFFGNEKTEIYITLTTGSFWKIDFQICIITRKYLSQIVKKSLGKLLGDE